MDLNGFPVNFISMGYQDLSSFLDKHCHFIFRGGKEAYGVIWKSNGALVFSSKDYHVRIQDARIKADGSDLLRVNFEDILKAEVIA